MTGLVVVLRVPDATDLVVRNDAAVTRAPPPERATAFRTNGVVAPDALIDAAVDRLR
jgi:hypothetical protein